METPSITLSFGGVDFCLISSCTGDFADTFSVSKICASDVEIDLNNFVGTLRIKNRYNSNIASGDAASSLVRTKRVNNPAVSGTKRAPDDDDEDYTPPENDDENDDDDITLEQLEKKKRPPTIEPLAKKKRVAAECSDDDTIKNTVEKQQIRAMIDLGRTSSSSAATFSGEKVIAKIHDTIFSSQVELDQQNLPKNAEKHLIELIKFRKIHGHCNVPYSKNKNTDKNSPLGDWVKSIRSAYRMDRIRRLEKGNHGEPIPGSNMFVTDSGSVSYNDELSQDLIERLNGMGFEWSVAFKEEVWMSKFEIFKEYVEKNGPCIPPRKHEIGCWIRDQRYHGYKRLRGEHAKISAERIQKLNDIGFEWIVSKIRERDAVKGRTSSGDASEGERGTEHQLVNDDSIPPAVPRDESLDEDNFDKLVVFRDTHGHCDVPLSNAELGPWVKDLRAAYTLHSEEDDASLTANFIQRLEEIGFRWTIPLNKDAAWAAKFDKLKEYAEANGDCFVPLKHKELGLWVRYQRSLYSKMEYGEKSPLTDARIAELESIGFEWKILKHPKKAGPVFI
mmetsp:Transcript_29808/g.56390  ORF Transcript_29808/g.56390 Transcript_29808/m.56390 type:complete len:561 (+) Transcript_29808:16-1698(+)